MGRFTASLSALFALLAIAMIAPPASSDAADDARYIVEQTVSEQMMAGTFANLRPVLAAAVESDLRESGITVENPDAFLAIFIEEFQDEFLAIMRRESVDIQLRLFDPEELAAIAAFYRSPAGQAVVRRTPELMQAGARIGAEAGRVAGANAGPRVAERLEAEGVRIVQDRSTLARLIEMLSE